MHNEEADTEAVLAGTAAAEKSGPRTNSEGKEDIWQIRILVEEMQGYAA